MRKSKCVPPQAFSKRSRLHSTWARGAVMEMSEALENKVRGRVLQHMSRFRCAFTECPKYSPVDFVNRWAGVQADYFDPSDKVEVKLWVLDGQLLQTNACDRCRQ